MKRLSAFWWALPLTLVGCAGTNAVTSLQHMVNPQQPVLEAGQSAQETAPLAANVTVQNVGLVIGVDPATGMPQITLGRRSVFIGATRGTTQGDSLIVADTVSASDNITIGTTAEVNPTD